MPVGFGPVFADIPEQQKLKETLAHRSRMVGQWQARTAKSNKTEEHAGADCNKATY
jgi:hypothetical protein